MKGTLHAQEHRGELTRERLRRWRIEKHQAFRSKFIKKITDDIPVPVSTRIYPKSFWQKAWDWVKGRIQKIINAR